MINNDNKKLEMKMQHLEFIQNNILRMGTNSFQIKTFSVTLITALLAVYATNKNVAFIFLGIPPTLAFWLLDSYYLQQERKFRGVYNDVASLTTVNEVKLYEMPLNKYKDDSYNFSDVLFSDTILIFCLTIFLILVIVSLIVIICS